MKWHVVSLNMRRHVVTSEFIINEFITMESQHTSGSIVFSIKD